jgi:hypothetical protein
MEAKKNNYFYGGHIGDPEVALYVDGLLKEELSPLPGEVLDHVEACPECKDKILDLYLFLKNPDFSAASPRGEAAEMPVKETRRFYKQRAAAIFLVALIFIAYFLVYKNGFFTGTDLLVDKENSARQQVTQKLNKSGSETTGKEGNVKKERGVDAAGREGRVETPPDYQVNPNLEIMIGSQSRSVGVQIHAPRNNVYLGKEILFSWDEVGPEPLHLKILNNKNEVLFAYGAVGNKVVFKEKLRPGLYYWKLESKNDLLYVGKFFIK